MPKKKDFWKETNKILVVVLAVLQILTTTGFFQASSSAGKNEGELIEVIKLLLEVTQGQQSSSTGIPSVSTMMPVHELIGMETEEMSLSVEAGSVENNDGAFFIDPPLEMATKEVKTTMGDIEFPVMVKLDPPEQNVIHKLENIVGKDRIQQVQQQRMSE